MGLTEKQQFKIGFLLRCAEQGLTMDETHLAIKSAINNTLTKKADTPWPLKPFAWGIDKSVNVGTSLLKSIPGILSTGSLLGLGLPIVGGAGAGYIAGKLTTPNKNIIEEAKQDETIGEYERLADEARRRARIKRLQQLTGKRIVALTPGER